MIRFNSRRILNGARVSYVRQFHNSRIAFQAPKADPTDGKDVPNLNPVVKKDFQNLAPIVKKDGPKKKRFSIFKFLFNTSIFATVVYGGVLFVATKNEKVMDFLIDQQPPLYEELLSVIETKSLEPLDGTYDNIKEWFQDLRYKLPSSERIDELAQRIENRSEDLIEETRKKFSNRRQDKGDQIEDITPEQQLQKPVETIQKTIEHLPLVKLNKDVQPSVDASVRATLDSFNDLILSIDASAQKTPRNEALIKTINENLSNLASKFDKLTSKFDEELKDKLKSSQTELLASYTKKELELTENLLYQFNNEKSKLEKRLNNTLVKEVEAAREAIMQAASNAVTMTRIEQIKEFESLVTDRIERERNGRLANLESLGARVDDLEKFAESLQAQITSNHKKSLLSRSISKLKSLLLFSEDISKPKLVAPYAKTFLETAEGTDDELLQIAVRELMPLISKESTHSILTVPQLLSRWKEIEPELRSASMLPPNAGLLGHLASVIFSKLLIPVKGSRPDGKDIESVIARVEEDLSRGELDNAVEEVANLKGWTRSLANDWVLEARKRLEIEFLLDVVETECSIL